MDPYIRKTTKPSKMLSNLKPTTSTSEERLLVTSLCLSPKTFARQIINEELNIN